MINNAISLSLTFGNQQYNRLHEYATYSEAKPDRTLPLEFSAEEAQALVKNLKTRTTAYHIIRDAAQLHDWKETLDELWRQYSQADCSCSLEEVRDQITEHLALLK